MEKGNDSFLSRILLTCCAKPDEPTPAPTIAPSPTDPQTDPQTDPPTDPPTAHGKGKGGGKGKGNTIKCNEKDVANDGSNEGRWGSASVPWNGVENLRMYEIVGVNCLIITLALHMMEFL